MLIHCREVTVKFKDKSKCGQRIANTEITGAYCLEVEDTGGWLVVCYCRKDESEHAYTPIKVICFAREEVAEYACEDSLTVM